MVKLWFHLSKSWKRPKSRTKQLTYRSWYQMLSRFSNGTSNKLTSSVKTGFKKNYSPVTGIHQYSESGPYHVPGLQQTTVPGPSQVTGCQQTSSLPGLNTSLSAVQTPECQTSYYHQPVSKETPSTRQNS